MREVKRSALVNKPPAELFALINDIESYPQFLPWCTQARVRSRTASEIVATLGMRQGALHGEFTTRNSARAAAPHPHAAAQRPVSNAGG